jgi:hypothetical protein
MPRVIRTSTRPGRSIDHLCRDSRGKRVEKKGVVNRLCSCCDTYIVYVWDNTPKPKPKTKIRRNRNGR